MKRQISLKLFLYASLFGCILFLLSEHFLSVFIIVTNVIIIILAIEAAAYQQNKKYPFLVGLAAVFAGSAVHYWELNELISNGSCILTKEIGFIDTILEIDNCLDYTKRWVRPAQAMLIAGFILVIPRIVSELYDVYKFFKYEYK